MSDGKQMAIPDNEALKKELNLVEVKDVKLEDTAMQDLETKADSFVENLVDFSNEDIDAQESKKAAVEMLGEKTQKEAAHRSQMLQRPIKDLQTRSQDGGEVSSALIDLKLKVEELDPNKIDFGKPGWGTRVLGVIPVVGNPLKKYFSRYEKSQTIIDAILNSLKNGEKQLKRDNIMLLEDQKKMRIMTLKLEKLIKLGEMVDTKLQYKLEREITPEDPKAKFIEEELLFPLRQRIMDLQQQLAVNQQGVLAIEIIIRNNRELIRGVNRAINVTVNALQVAVTVALALAHQKIVIDKIAAVNETTSNLISATAARLKTQGAEIHKQAASSMLDAEKLKGAFNDIKAALDDISSFRKEALPRMAQTILEFDELTQKGEEAIKKFEKGNKVNPSVTLDIE